MRVMISQPMKNRTEADIRQERKSIIEKFNNMHIEVIDTIFTEEAPENNNAGVYYLGKSIEFMSKADIVYFMKGWEEAKGCKIENKICQYYGKQTMYNIYEEE